MRAFKLDNLWVSIKSSVHIYIWASLVAQLVKNLPAMWETWVRSLGWKITWRRERLPSPLFWPGELHELYSPWGRKKSDTTEQLSLSYIYIYIHTHTYICIGRSILIDLYRYLDIHRYINIYIHCILETQSSCKIICMWKERKNRDSDWKIEHWSKIKILKIESL